MTLGIHILLVISTFFTAFYDHDLQEDLAVIVHESVDVESIDKDDLLEIYTLNRQNWRGDTNIIVSDYKGNSDVRDIFYDYIGTNVNSIKRIWLRAQFTGRTTPPNIVKSIDEMIESVLDRPGTIGYVPMSKVPEGAKVLLRINHEH